MIISIFLIASCDSSDSQFYGNIDIKSDDISIQNSNSKISNGERKKINLDLSFNEQITNQMPRDKRIDNIFEGLSTDLYSLIIKY
ncbi:hypothetical protein OAD84_05105 [Pelagibacterales bacterium]|nr:hypothetical protein [Pelagibacterales bacterium]